MWGQCELFEGSGDRCRGSALSRCSEDKAVYCAAHRGFRRGIPADDRCAACEGAAPDARREARAIAADQDVAAVRLMHDPVVLADLVRARGVQTHVGVMTKVAAGGGWLRGRRSEAEDTRFWLINLETDAADPTKDVGLGLTTHGAWVRHVRPAGSGLPPTLLPGVFPTTAGARELVRWFHRHNVELPA